jgi:hypothetical protein
MRSPERQGRYPDDAVSSGHHGPCPSSLSAGKSTFRPKTLSQGQKCFVHHGPKYDLVELAGSGIPRDKTRPTADWQRNLVPALFGTRYLPLLCAPLVVIHLIIDIIALIGEMRAATLAGLAPPATLRGPVPSAGADFGELLRGFHRSVLLAQLRTRPVRRNDRRDLSRFSPAIPATYLSGA